MMITTYPNAKINIGLRVVERRSDGYHNIETIFYPIALQDTLHVAPSSTCSDYNFSAAGIHLAGDPENNLVIKALRLLRKDFDIPPVDISLYKQIPFGAGLGGGSSDSAFMIKALNDLFELELSSSKMKKIAAQIGADCPFFIENKPVYATGTGNIFTPTPLSLAGYWILLVKPDIFVSTPESYRAIEPQKPKSNLMDLIQSPIEMWKESIINDFEKPVFEQHPFIAEIKQELYRSGALYASMSGSGSAVYGLFDKEPPLSPLFDDCFVVSGQLD